MLIILVLIIIFIPQILTLESKKSDENIANRYIHDSSCTRWQFWDGSNCKNLSRNFSYYYILYNMEKITIPFIGASAIFVITTTTPRISKLKRISMIIPCVVLLGYSLFVIFSRVRW